MYLELLDKNKIKQGQKTRKKKHDHVKKKKKVQKKIERMLDLHG